MDFYSAYRHGFVRVAACTIHTAIAEPAANAESVLRLARECHDDGVALAVFPELTLSGYSIEDILLQDALLDAVEAAVGRRGRRPPPSCCRCWWSARRCATATASTTPRSWCTAAGARRRAEVVPADLPRVLRAAAVRPRRRCPRAMHPRRRRRRAVRSRPAVRRGRVPGFVLHVEMCEDMWVPVPPSAEAALAGATVLVNLSGSPITIARAEDRELLARSASARCLAAYVYAAAGEGESSTDLAWDGQTMIYENGGCWPRPNGSRRATRRSVADVDLGLLRQERLRMGTFDDNRAPSRRPHRAFRRVEFHVDPPGGDIGLRREVERFPFVPSDAARLRTGLLRGATTSRSPGLEQRLRAIELSEDGHRRLGRAGLDPRADRRGPCDGPGGPAAQRHPGVHDARDSPPASGPRTMRSRSSRALGVTFAETRHPADGRADAQEMGHPFGRGEPVYDVTFENVQAGLRTDYLFRIANQRGGIVLGTGDLSELALGWSTYGVGDQMSHYNVNSGVPKTLIQHLIRWVISSGQFERRGATRYCSRSSTPRSPRSWCPPARTRSCRAPRPRSGRSRCRTSRCSTSCATASGRRRSRSWPGTPGATPSAAPGRPASRGQAAGLLAEGDPALAGGVRASGSIRSASSSARRCRTGRRCRRRLAVAAR